MKISLYDPEVVNAAQAHDSSVLPLWILVSWAGAGGVLKGQVKESQNLMPALGWEINKKNLDVRDVFGITVSLLPS